MIAARTCTCAVVSLVAVAGLFAQSPPGSAELRIVVRNALARPRGGETVEVPASALRPLAADGDLARLHVFDPGSGKEILAQGVDEDGDGKEDTLVFQADLPAGGERAFAVPTGERRVYRKEDFRVYGRFVRERHDDFAWENDRVAHRMYGEALETWAQEPLTSSTLDVWVKRTRRLVLNDWYMADDYHRDHGEGADFYSAGPSRGCGGSGIWSDGQLRGSRNFRGSRVLAAGPIRLVFELRYLPWDIGGGRAVSERKRVTLDAGSNFNRFDNLYTVAGGAGEPSWAAGIKKAAGADVRIEKAAGWIRTWEPIRDGNGHLGCVVLLDPAAVVDVTEAAGNVLAVARPGAGGRASYHAGSAWDRSGDFAGVAEWDRQVQETAERVRSPLQVEVRPH
jgi:Domain of unknown function (DUF4861)